MSTIVELRNSANRLGRASVRNLALKILASAERNADDTVIICTHADAIRWGDVFWATLESALDSEVKVVSKAVYLSTFRWLRGVKNVYGNQEG